jgi:hypothetical protein
MALVRADVSEERTVFIIRVTVAEQKALAASNNRSSAIRLLVSANVVPSLPILVTLLMRRYVPSKRRFLQEPHGVTSQKTAVFIVTAVKTWHLKSVTRF